MKKAAYLLLINALLLLCACDGTKVPTCNGIVSLTNKTNRNNIGLSGSLDFRNSTKQDIYLVELYLEVTVDGKNLSTAITRDSRPVYADSSFRMSFSANIPTNKVFDEGEKDAKHVEIGLKGYLKSRTDEHILNTEIDLKRDVLLQGIRGTANPEDEPNKDTPREKRKKKRDAQNI